VDSAIFMALRRLRAPLIVLIAVYAIGMLGMVLIPGRDADGNEVRMGFFHAFYFVSYTASTIGFGEIPNAFTDAQRLWTTAVIFLSVFGWAYAVTSVLALRSDRAFLAALHRHGFARQVRVLREPFYILCGFGETGALVCEGLDRSGLRVVVIEVEPERAAEVELRAFQSSVPALAADAKAPGNLLLAGLARPSCQGVLAMTDDESANLGVAIAARLLNPTVAVLARSLSPTASANLASFGTELIINPFRLLGEYLGLLLRAPAAYHLLDRLVGSAASPEIANRSPPRGRWIVCGYGRFGREVVAALEAEGIEVTVVEPDPGVAGERPHIRGRGNDSDSLRAAGVEGAVGIVAGTNDDVSNLSIAVTARHLNAKLYVILRQNHTANEPVFAAYRADFTVVSRAIIAEHCIAMVRTPLLGRFIARIRSHDACACEEIPALVEQRLGDRHISAWTASITASGAPAVTHSLPSRHMTLEALMRDPAERERLLDAVPLLLHRDGQDLLLPAAGLELAPGDQVLFAGTQRARQRQRSTLMNRDVLDYVVTGRDIESGWLWRRLAPPRARAS
jgi:Trk K+ transport system NAD-binding subunit